MYLINKDETEHTGQVRRHDTLMTFSLREFQLKQCNSYYPVTDAGGWCV